MKYPPSFLDEIRARVPVSEVVSGRVKLKKQGREWRGLSPFGAEKTPSFYVNDQKGFYHDFSSGKHGDAFSFLMEVEGLTFPEAVEKLANLAGVPMPVQSPESAAFERKRAGLNEVMELAAKFFEDSLHGRFGAKARGYLADRGLTPAIQQQFRIGYSLGEKFALRDYLADKGATVETMIEAGLLIHGTDIAVPYDRFRDRVMFPIADRAGKIIAFGGRALDKDAQAKYLNSPETSLFHKGSVVYNHHNARKAAHDKGTVIAVEGYVDVISMSVAGFPHTVAPLGTALTADQCELLWRMAEEPILCFDGDKAGRKAAYRAIETALPLISSGKTLRFALLPEGQDPDDLARSGGFAAISEVLGKALPLVDLLWQKETENQTFDTPERRAALERRLNEVIREIRDETLRRYYQEDLRARLGQMFGRGAGGSGQRKTYEVNNRGFSGRGPGRGGRFNEPQNLMSPTIISSSLTRSAMFSSGPTLPQREALILMLMLNHPQIVLDHAEDLSTLEFSSPDAAKLRDCAVQYAADPDLTPDDVQNRMIGDGLGAILQKLENNIALGTLVGVPKGSVHTDSEEVLRQAMALHRKARALNKELQLAEVALGNDANEQNLARLRDIQEQLSALGGTEAAIEGFGTLSGRSERGL